MANIINGSYKYYAFISYKSEDVEWAIWLQHELEHYRLPASYNGRMDVCQELRPVFRDIDELSAGNLPTQIQQALQDSQNLIVICSPQAARSPWVNQEIEIFKSLGRVNRIFPFIVDGKGPADYFPPALLDLPKNEERLGGEIRKNGRDAALVKVVAGMLGVGFDSLWNRYEKEKVEKERKEREDRNRLYKVQSRFLSEKALELVEMGDSYLATLLALQALPSNLNDMNDRPLVVEAEIALRQASIKNEGKIYLDKHAEDIHYTQDSKYIIIDEDIYNIKTGEILDKTKYDLYLAPKYEIRNNLIVTTEGLTCRIIETRELPFDILLYDINSTQNCAIVVTKDRELLNYFDLAHLHYAPVMQLDFRCDSIKISPNNCFAYISGEKCALVNLYNLKIEYINESILMGQFDKKGNRFGYIHNFGEPCCNSVRIFDLFLWEWIDEIKKGDVFFEKFLFISDEHLLVLEGLENRISRWSININHCVDFPIQSLLPDNNSDCLHIDDIISENNDSVVAIKLVQYGSDKKKNYIVIHDFKRNAGIKTISDEHEIDKIIIAPDKKSLIYAYKLSNIIRIIDLTLVEPQKKISIPNTSQSLNNSYKCGKYSLLQMKVCGTNSIFCLSSDNKIFSVNKDKFREFDFTDYNIDNSSDYAFSGFLRSERGFLLHKNDCVQLVSCDYTFNKCIHNIVTQRDRFAFYDYSLDGRWLAFNQREKTNSSKMIKYIVDIQKDAYQELNESKYGYTFFSFNYESNKLFCSSCWNRKILSLNVNLNIWETTDASVVRNSADNDRPFDGIKKAMFASSESFILILNDQNQLEVINASDLSAIYTHDLSLNGNIQGFDLSDDDKYLVLFSNQEIFVKDPIKNITYLSFKVKCLIKDVQFTPGKGELVVLTKDTLLLYSFPDINELISLQRQRFNNRNFTSNEKEKYYLE